MLASGQHVERGESPHLFASDLWLPQRAEHHVGTLHLPRVGPLALQAAQSIFRTHTVPLRYPGHCLEGGGKKEESNRGYKTAV